MKQIVLTDLDSLVSQLNADARSAEHAKHGKQGFAFVVHYPDRAPDDSRVNYRSARFQDALRRDGCSPGVDTETVFAAVRRLLKREQPQGFLFEEVSTF